MSDPPGFPAKEMSDRLACIRAEMAALKLDAMISTDAANIRYTTDFRGEPGTLLVTADALILYTSFRTLPWAEKQTQNLGAAIELCTTPAPLDDIRLRLSGGTIRLGVDRSVAHQEYLRLHRS